MIRFAPLLSVFLLTACRSGLVPAECDPQRPCPASADPCRRSYCTWAGECATRPINEGGECGISDCVSARVCVEGACTIVPASDGATCAPATPCRDAGTCAGGACRTPDARPLATALWEVRPEGPGSRISPIAVDGAGNFHWQECFDPTSCAKANLVSVDPAGARRFRIPVAGASMPVIAGDAVVRAGGCFRDGAAVRGAFVEARAAADGAIRWTYDGTNILPAPPGTSCHKAAFDLVYNGADTLYAIVGIVPTNTVKGAPSAVALDIGTGAMRWSRSYNGYWNWGGDSQLLGDVSGGIAFRVGDETIALDAEGRERFRAPNLDFLVAAAEGRLFDVSFTTGDGKMHYVYGAWNAQGRRDYELGPRQIRAMPLVAPVFAGGAGYAFDAGNDYTGESLVRFDPARGDVAWRTPLAIGGNGAAGTDLIATARDSLLFVQSNFSSCDDTRCNYVAAHMLEVSISGAPRWTCELPAAQYAYSTLGTMGTMALGHGVVAVAGADGVVRGYALPGAEAAEGAWTAGWGGMRRAGRGAK